MHVSSIQRLKRVEMPTCCTKKLGSQLQAAVQCRIEDSTNSVIMTVNVLWRLEKHNIDSTQYAQAAGMPGNAVVLPLLTTRSGVGRTALGLGMLLAQTHSLSYQSCCHCVEHQDPPVP
jgi:hypothetical protein